MKRFLVFTGNEERCMPTYFRGMYFTFADAVFNLRKIKDTDYATVFIMDTSGIWEQRASAEYRGNEWIVEEYQ